LLARVYVKLGHGYGHAGLPAETEEARRQALAAFDRLARAFPTVPRYQAERFRAQWFLADLLWETGRRAEAEEAYRRVTAFGDGLHRESLEHQEVLASFLVICYDPRFRDGRRAVALAQRAVERSPQHAAAWSTLGMAHYRAGDWAAAIAALEKGLALRQGGDCGDWLVLALVHARRGERDEARWWYDRATRWLDEHPYANRDWPHFRAEAAELLDASKPR
jgi:tetratricopeptide (TPR) repeat protein